MSRSEARSEHRELTKRQLTALEALADDDRNMRIVGWDTAVSGPLLEMAVGGFVAISPRGKEVPRPRKDA